MFMLKFGNLFRRTVIMVMILTVVHAGVLGSSAAVLAESANVLPDTVYRNTTPPGVANSVYGGEEYGPVLPSALIFLQETILYEVPASAGNFTVSGRVYENSTRMPLAGVTVKLMLNGHPTQFDTSTDSEGRYNLNGVGIGQYQLYFQYPGYASEEFLIDVIETDAVQNCSLLRNTSFKGQVVNHLGHSLEGAEVTLVDQNLKNRDILLSTNAGGMFYLTDVPPGRYRLTVSQSVYKVQKMIWVDEYPKDIKMILSTDAVNVEIPVVTDDEPPNVNDEVYGNSNDGDEAVPGTGGEVPAGEPQDGNADPGAGGEAPVGVSLDALKEHDPLNELNDLLNEQATIN